MTYNEILILKYVARNIYQSSFKKHSWKQQKQKSGNKTKDSNISVKKIP